MQSNEHVDEHVAVQVEALASNLAGVAARCPRRRGRRMNRAQAGEDDYFKQQEADTRLEQQSKDAQQKALAEQVERDRAIALQLRRCPRCRTVLAVQTRHHVDVEICNQCNGVWLDEGKLERLLRPNAPLLRRLGRWLGWR